MAFSIGFTVPDELLSYQEELAAAMKTAVPVAWDEERTFEYALQAEAIGHLLVERIHRDLFGANIAYLFREKMKGRGKEIWGKASMAGSKLEFFSDRDFVLEFNWERWRRLAPIQKVALVDHELQHCGYDENEKTGERKWCLLSHDIEEFGSIVTRWGLWRNDLIVFSGAMQHAHQAGLFENLD